MLRDKYGISKKEKNHPQASDGSFRQEHQLSVPTSTVNIVSQNVTKSNITKQETLENYLREAAQHFQFAETMDAKIVFDIIEKRGRFTVQELEGLRKFRSKMKNRPRNVSPIL